MGSIAWRLLLANPIVVRVVATGGRRVRQMWARGAYLGALFVVLLIWSGALLNPTLSLSELAKNATQTFVAVSIVQLALMSFIAPVFTAAAITQERDGATFDILLTTPLSNAQIVLGSLLSRLFFVWALLLSGLPVFCITMIYGGVTTKEVFESLGLAAATALLTGSIAITIAMLRLGARRTLFAFFVGIAAYLLGVFAVGWSGWSAVAEAPVTSGTDPWIVGQRMSWLAPFHPFLALFVTTGLTPAPRPEDVAPYGPVWAWLLATPQYAYMTLTVVASAVMVVISLLFVRAGAKEGENTLFARFKALVIRQTTDRSHAPRRVWANPIAWREAVTRGSAFTRGAVRALFVVGGLAAGVVLLVGYERGAWGFAGLSPEDAAAQMRSWLTVIVWIEMATILLVVTNTAAGTLTREKESLTIEILLTTPLTSRYIVGGMLQGVVRSGLPLVAAPTGMLLTFAVYDLFRPASGVSVLTPEAALLTPIMLVSFSALAVVIGLQFSLTSRKTVHAVMFSATIVLGASGLLWICGFAIASSGGGGDVAAVALPFTPFPAMQALIDVPSLFQGSQPDARELRNARVARIVTSLISAAIYAAITFSLYRNLVRNFDMTVRRQMR